MPSISHLLLFIASTDALRTPSNSRRGVITGAAASATLLNAVPPAFAQGKKPRSDPSYGVVKSPAEWKEYLTDYQYFVLREGGTEKATRHSTRRSACWQIHLRRMPTAAL